MQKDEWQKGVIEPGEEMIQGVERMDIFLPQVKQFKEDLVVAIQDSEDAEVSTREQRQTIKVLWEALEQAFFANIFVISSVVQFLGDEERMVYLSLGAKIRKTADIVIAWGTNQTEVREEFAKLDMKRKRWHRALASGADGLAWKALKEQEVSEIKGMVAKSEAAATQMRGWEWLVRNGGSGPLFPAAQHGRVEAARFCLDNGISAETKDSLGNTPLYIAALKNKVAIAQMLLDTGTDVNHVNKFGRTALWVASQNDNAEVLQVLLTAGAFVDVQDSEGASPLWIAARSASRRVIPLLIKAGAAVDALGHHGMTALMSAAYHGDVEAVKVLKQAGASLQATGGAPERMLSAYQWSSIRGHTECMKLLEPTKWAKLHLMKKRGSLGLIGNADWTEDEGARKTNQGKGGAMRAARNSVSNAKAEAAAALAELMEAQKDGEDVSEFADVLGLVDIKPEIDDDP
jgi:ankyrin repeat protein